MSMIGFVGCLTKGDIKMNKRFIVIKNLHGFKVDGIEDLKKGCNLYSNTKDMDNEIIYRW